MERREAIRRTAWIMGGIVSAPSIMGILNGCTAKPTIDWKPSFFTEDQGILISRVADIIIPKTDTPGAVEAGVPPFIDRMYADVYSEEDQKKFLDGMQAFDDDAKNEYGDAFIDLSDEKQAAYVNACHEKAMAASNGEWPFIMKMKELTFLGFFTSKPGATEVLQYEAVPGDYKGCLSLKEVGKTWAT